MGHDEMKSNVKQLARLQAGLEQARDDLEGINEEERLLEWEQSVFPQLNTMFQLKEPYDKLWNTAWTFHQKHENWMNGPFTSLNDEEIENEVGDMWRSMYKLTKTFGDQPDPRRIADSVKGKIDKFKQHLPILHTICNPGIRDRHWEAMSNIVGFDLKPQPDNLPTQHAGVWPQQTPAKKFKVKPTPIQAGGNFNQQDKGKRGQTPADAEYNYLDKAKRLEMYGVDLNKARDQSNLEIHLGVTSVGLVVFQNNMKINTFPWSKIVKISFKRKQFFIQLRREQSDSVENLIGFNMVSYRSCKNMWKSCVEHHTFFRLHTPNPPSKKMFSIGSRFRYRLEEIGAAAVKEYSLEKALEKMKFEWQDMCFELIPYRETATVGRMTIYQNIRTVKDPQSAASYIGDGLG